MNRFSSALAAIAFLATGLPALGQKGVEVTGISSSFVRTPDISFKGETKRTPRTQNWLEIEVEFTYAPAANDPKVLEELKFDYYVYIKPLDRVLKGEVTHMHIEAGRGKMSVMYLAPQTLVFLADGKSISATDVNPVGVQVFYRGQLVAESSSRGAPQGQWWTSLQNIQGSLLNKNNTPFAALHWDRYELIKPDAR